jgi:hypothetical protein
MTTAVNTSRVSRDLREEFILDFIKMCSMADIPLGKVDLMKPFLIKHCKQGGAIPGFTTLRETYMPRLFLSHLDHLKKTLRDKKVSIIADETTDCRDKSILNVIAGLNGRYYLIDVVSMEACNHATLSQTVINSLNCVGINYTDVIAFVTDSAAYCLKAYNDILQHLLPNAKQVPCLAHVLNLTGDVYVKWKDFSHLATLIGMMKSVFFKKPGRKQRYLAFLGEYLPQEKVKLPPVPVSTR